MDTVLSPINVPGWDTLLLEHRTRALTLQALTNLELGFYKGDLPARPSTAEIVTEVIRLGGEIAGNSSHTVLVHLEELAEAGHVVKRKGKSPWHSRYLVLPEPKAAAAPAAPKKKKAKKEESNEIPNALPAGSVGEPQPHSQPADGAADPKEGAAPVEDGPAPEGSSLD